jgi:TolB protein
MKVAFECFSSSYYEAGICVVNADGPEQTNLTHGGARDFHPTWSPDGTKIAFGSNGDIFTVKPDGTEQNNFTKSDQWDENPEWSPNSKKIAFESAPVGGEEIYAIKADGSEQTNLTKELGTLDAMPAWSPDGEKIAFMSNRNGRDNIFTMNVDGTEQTNLTRFTGSPTRGEGKNMEIIHTENPTWSPDGKRIAFDSNHAGSGQTMIYVVKASGSN